MVSCCTIAVSYRDGDCTHCIALAASLGKQVRQFHQEGDRITAEYYLGKSTLATNLATRPAEGPVEVFNEAEPVLKTFVSPEHSSPIPYYSIDYMDGTPCDITGAPRYVSTKLLLCAPHPACRLLTRAPLLSPAIASPRSVIFV